MRPASYRPHRATAATTDGPEAVLCGHARWAVRVTADADVWCRRCLRLLGVRVPAPAAVPSGPARPRRARQLTLGLSQPAEVA